MSPDISDLDSGSTPRGKRVTADPYTRMTVPWRSSELTQLLHALDKVFLHFKVETGKDQKGNPPRIRSDPKRPIRDPDSRAPGGLPRTCYDDGWYRGLGKREREDLEVTARVDLALPAAIRGYVRFVAPGHSLTRVQDREQCKLKKLIVLVWLALLEFVVRRNRSDRRQSYVIRPAFG